MSVRERRGWFEEYVGGNTSTSWALSWPSTIADCTKQCEAQQMSAWGCVSIDRKIVTTAVHEW